MTNAEDYYKNMQSATQLCPRRYITTSPYVLTFPVSTALFLNHIVIRKATVKNLKSTQPDCASQQYITTSPYTLTFPVSMPLFMDHMVWKYSCIRCLSRFGMW